MASVELLSIRKAFAGGVEALSGIDLGVTDGEFLAIVGPSGSGKSTLLRLVAGLESSTSGSIRIGGKEADRLAPADRDAAIVFQEPAPFPHLSVFENLAFGLRARRFPPAEIRVRVHEVAAVLGLSDILDRKPAALSGGQRRRVVLGRALARRPGLLLLDEPFSSLDAPLRASLQTDLIALHRRFGTTTLLVTHDQAEALAMGDRVAVLDGGRLSHVGTPADIYERPASKVVGAFVGDPPMAFLPTTAGGRATELGIRAEDVQLLDGDEHDAYGLATIIRLEPRGHERIATLDFRGQLLFARLSARGRRAVGETVAFRLDLTRASWFDAAGVRVESNPPDP